MCCFYIGLIESEFQQHGQSLLVLWHVANIAIHDICRGHRRHCLSSKYFHVEQFCSTWKFVRALWKKIALHEKSNFATHENFAFHVEQTCPMWKAILLHIVCFIMIFSKSIWLWFALFWHKIDFVAIYALLCGAKINPIILSVEQKLQISCMAPDPKQPSTLVLAMRQKNNAHGHAAGHA